MARFSMGMRRSVPMEIPLLSSGESGDDSGLFDSPSGLKEAQHIKSHLGEKNISLFGSIVLTVNNVSGPGMLVLPIVFVQAGWLPMLIIFLWIWMVSTLSASFLCDAIARVPENREFQKRVEFSTAFEHYYGKKGYIIAQLGVILCLLSQALASIITNGQVMDQFLVFLFKKTFALQFNPHFGFVAWPEVECTAEVIHDGLCIPFASVPDGIQYGTVLTLGYIVTLVIIMPMGAMNLEDNILVQYVSFTMLIVLMGEFLVHFFLHGLHIHDVPAIGNNFSQVLGPIMFNYAFVVTIPSWVNEKKPNVSVNKAMWISTTCSTIGYILVGLLGAWSYPRTPQNFLTALASASADTTTRVCAFLFSLGIIGLGIPVFLIMMRYNLIVGRVCRPHLATFWGVIFPWLCAWIFYQGDLFLQVINYTSLVVNGFVNFVGPLLMTLRSIGMYWWFRDDEGKLHFLYERPDVPDDMTSVSPLPKFMTRRRTIYLLVSIIGMITPLIFISIAISIIN